MTRTYKTTLRCGGCVGTIAPVLDAAPGVRSWSADTDHPDKLLTVDGDDLSADRLDRLLGPVGYRVLGEVAADADKMPVPPDPPPTSYYPLALLIGYILGVVLLAEVAAGGFDGMRAMRHFMAGFFLAFSFFKLLDLTAFADAYQTYDLLAARSRAYAVAYPFVELGLGVAYLVGVWPTATNAVTLVVMLVGTAGVLNTLFAGRKVRCACLGAVFNLPMSYVTLAEDGVMAVMAAVMLVL